MEVGLSELMLDYLIKRFLKMSENPYQSRYEGYSADKIFIFLGYSISDINKFIDEHPDIYKDAQEFARIMSYL